jgi:eukaryotic-like serine/threonine-protein kinase
MPLTSGTKLGPYEIQSPLGAGGMGEVYRARDTRLGRDVAIKVLPEHLCGDPNLKSRFEREARAISALSHPHICHLYDVGSQAGTDYLVMELLQGESLADRLQKGALPLSKALQVGIEIAEALETAHKNGIVHRDLKPGNVMLTKSGAKLLDFGLAKPALSRAAIASGAAATMTKALTAEGRIIGTFQYMAPEQVQGHEADARTDLFALGTVLYEMVTGRRAFHGKSEISVMSAILEREPESISAVQPLAPPMLDHVIQRALAKDPDERWQSVSDLKAELKWIAAGSGQISRATPTGPAAPLKRFVPLAAAILVVLALSWSFSRLFPAGTLANRPVTRLVVTVAPEGLGSEALPHIALSPDGSHLVYVATHQGNTMLYSRSLESFDSAPIFGTEGAESPFFSPDGQTVGFFADGKMKKVSVTGGAPTVIAIAGAVRGGSWGSDGSIVFAPSITGSLFRVSANGGTVKPLTMVDRKNKEFGHRWPQILPGGKAVLFTIWTGGNFDNARIGLVSLVTGEKRILLEGGYYARYVHPGYLVYARAGELLAVPFDLDRLEISGQSVPILKGVITNVSFGTAEFSSSNDGTLAYLPGGSQVGDRTLAWVDSKGIRQPLPAPPGGYLAPRISPDGKQVAISLLGNSLGMWVYDLGRGTLTRLTSEGVIPFPVWSRDGGQLTFSGTVDDRLNLYRMNADGSGTAERLTTNENAQWPGSWSPGGDVLAFTEAAPETGYDLMTINLHGDPQPHAFLQTSSNEYGPNFSPNGHWLAYGSDESGRQEIYVRPFPGPGGKSQISTEGGLEPVWSRDGRELFYRNGDKMMAATIQTAPTLAASKPRLLFEQHFEKSIFPFEANYDVSPDGKRFLLVVPSEGESAPAQINVVLNWSEELRRLIRAEK